MTTTPKLTGLALLRECLRLNTETGKLTWKIARRGIRKGAPAGGRLSSNGYLRVCVGGQLYYAHRVVWALANGVWPVGVIDHINGDKTDNRPTNLRDVSVAVNQHNQRVAQRTDGRTSGLLGVSWAKANNKWRAAIKVAGRSKFIGYFDSEAAAHAAYLDAKSQLHGAAV